MSSQKPARGPASKPAAAPAVDDEARALFAAATHDVRKLAPRPKAEPARRRRPPRARFARAERAAVLAESLGEPGPLIATQAGDELEFRRPGGGPTILRRLRGGEYRVDAALDLHGMTGREAHEAVRGFLQRALANHWLCLRIIHGKGMRSGPRGPVLKATVNTLLRRADPVLAFASARARDGGTGATLVLLRRRPA